MSFNCGCKKQEVTEKSGFTKTEQAGQDAAAKKVPPKAIGEKGSAGDWDFIVDMVALNPQIDGASPPAGREFLIVDFTITNNSKKIAGTGPAYFKLTNKKGQSYKVKETQDRIFNMNPVETGASSSSSMVFEVPENEKGLTLVFEPFIEGKSVMAEFKIR